MFGVTKTLAQSLSDAYLDTSRINGYSPAQEVTNLTLPTARKGLGRINWIYDHFSYEENLGTAAMLVAEKKIGVGVYERAMKDDYSFLRVTEQLTFIL